MPIFQPPLEIKISNKNYLNRKDGAEKALAEKLFALFNETKNIETISQCHIAMINNMSILPNNNNIPALPNIHNELTIFHSQDAFKKLPKEHFPDDIYNMALNLRETVDLHNLSAAILKLAANPDCKAAAQRNEKHGEWIKFEALAENIKKIVVEAGDCELKTDIEYHILKNNSKGQIR